MTENHELPTIRADLCTACGLCVEYCPVDAVELVDGRPVITFPQKCVYCGLCEEMCPAGAVELLYEVVILPKREKNPAKNRVSSGFPNGQA